MSQVTTMFIFLKIFQKKRKSGKNANHPNIFCKRWNQIAVHILKADLTNDTYFSPIFRNHLSFNISFKVLLKMKSGRKA